ncbi:methyl-accepting chemotaxis protein [Motiliproteus sp. SC1-56]|uniref:methyl-accepting chemotaxis protein n=1 Tax=Motiliproteus sp. SC1-56 TaxID=2799565 RepID=UPI001A90450A|nr:methyl-accepting chemotaxis protein [Motiliproteus sp. SC1-56]
MKLLANLSIRLKLALAFGLLTLLLVISNLSGYRGIELLNGSVVVISEESVPVLDTAHSLGNVLLKGQTLLQEFDSQTSVLASAAEQAHLEQIKAEIESIGDQFEQNAKALSSTGDTTDLSILAKQADTLFIERFVPLEQALINSGHKRQAAKSERDADMAAMEAAYESALASIDTAETGIKRWIANTLDNEDGVSYDGLMYLLRNVVPYVDGVMEMKFSLLDARVSIEEIAQQNEQGAVATIHARYAANNAHFDALLNAMMNGGEIDGDSIPALVAPHIRRLVEAADNEHARFQTAADEIVDAQRRLLTLSEASAATRRELFTVEQQIGAITEQIKAHAGSQMERAKEQAAESHSAALTELGAALALALLLASLLSWRTSASICTRLSNAVGLSKRLAKGDLTARVSVQCNDELGVLQQSLNDTGDRLRDMVNQIAAATEQLSGSSDEVAAITTQTAGNIAAQTEQLNQTSVAVNEMSATVRQVAKNATEAAQSTRHVDSEAKRGRGLVENVDQSIQELSVQIEETKGAINRLSDEITGVDSILEVITGVAEQTNLLALNAAIEAARAGEQGRGFTVVADEVRSLASRTQDSTSTIQAMIGRLKAEAAHSVESMTAGNRKAQLATELSQQANEALAEIEKAVSTIADMNTQIASASEEQSAVAEQINVSVHEIEKSAGETSAGAQQVAVATDQVAQLSDNLKTLVGHFKVS